jgi:hypothetical protein
MYVLSSSPMIGLGPAIEVLYVHDRYMRSFGHPNIARPLPMTSRMSHVEVLVSKATCCLCVVAVLINTMYQRLNLVENSKRERTKRRSRRTSGGCFDERGSPVSRSFATVIFASVFAFKAYISLGRRR